MTTIKSIYMVQCQVRSGTRSGLGVLEAARQQRHKQIAEEVQAAAMRASEEAGSRERFVRDSSGAYGRRRAAGQLWSAWRVLEQLEAAAVLRAESASMQHRGEGEGGDPSTAPPAAEGLQRATGPLPAAFRGLMPAPPSYRAVQLVERLPELWIPDTASISAASAEHGAVGCGDTVGGVGSQPEDLRPAASTSGASEIISEPLHQDDHQREDPIGVIPASLSSSSAAGGPRGGGTATDTTQAPVESHPPRADLGGIVMLAPPLSEQLDLLLCFLRANHLYCLHCGCVYDSQDQMEESCPGPSEELH